ncbi:MULTISPECIES: DUF1330 domain-containing protein [unclassified Burkholderia]|uniref:DUF1330 domain-containing protein n=1 Tax=unclassified Burkholderia TaxID=2613784 RepID=UPI002AB2B783|nr:MULTISPECIES: DUF1330 domain-containing protein [unclassified Burkholderia]
MAKAYWVSAYRSVSDDEKLAAYSKLAGEAISAGGGRVLARGVAAAAYESGVAERTAIVEFDSLEKAIAARESEGYRAAVAALDGGAERDFRIVEGQ